MTNDKPRSDRQTEVRGYRSRAYSSHPHTIIGCCTLVTHSNYQTAPRPSSLGVKERSTVDPKILTSTLDKFQRMSAAGLKDTTPEIKKRRFHKRNKDTHSLVSAMSKTGGLGFRVSVSKIPVAQADNHHTQNMFKRHHYNGNGNFQMQSHDKLLINQNPKIPKKTI